MDPVVAVQTTRVTGLAAQLVGLGVLAGAVALAAALLYRWYVREAIPRGLAVLLGLAAVAAYLNTTTILGEVIVGTSDVTQVEEAMFNIGAFAAGLFGATVGRGVGDGIGVDVFETASFGGVDADVGRLVTALGRVVTVELPEEIDDVVGYDPVPAATKATLAGRSFVFPRRLTVGELRDRLVARLKTDYAIGHVDVELGADGTVEYLAVGSRAAGIGPTLPPATRAVAVRADPAFAASAGDVVQVWETDPMERVLTAELRGTAGDVVTLAIDTADTPKLDPDERYRLVTLPVEDRPDREFVSLLRGADETVASTTVQEGSPLSGTPVSAVEALVVAVTRAGGEEQIVLPTPDQRLSAGDVLHAIARPEVLRRIETAAAPGAEDSPVVADADDVADPDNPTGVDVATDADNPTGVDDPTDASQPDGGTSASDEDDSPSETADERSPDGE